MTAFFYEEDCFVSRAYEGALAMTGLGSDRNDNSLLFAITAFLKENSPSILSFGNT